jgi:hypothetical protein
MGQFDSQSAGLPPIGKIGLSDSDRGIGLPKRTRPMYVETKKKDKPKTAAAGSPPPPPPDKPPKGPKGPGPKNPKDGKDYKKDKDANNSKSGLTKGSRKEETKNPRNKK